MEELAERRQRQARVAVLVLAVCCLCWGYSFPVMQIAAREIEAATGHQTLDTRLELAVRATFNGWRFGAAALVYALITFARHRGFSRDELLGGTVVGVFFGAGMFLQVLGLRYTRPSVSAFLTSLAVVFAPIAQALLLRRPVEWRVWLAVCLAMVGITVLSQTDASSQAANTISHAPPIPYTGEILTVLAALLFTGQILAVDHFGKRSDPTRLTLAMLATTAAVSLLCGSLLSGAALYQSHALTTLISSGTFWWSFWSLVVFSSVVALHLMNGYQPLVAPATAAVVYCLEPLFATSFSVAFGAEHVTRATVIGGVMVLLAVLTVVQWKAPSSSAPPAEPRRG